MKPSRRTIQDGIVVPVPGEHIRFENGRFTTEDKNKIDFIESHWLFGTAIVRVDEKPKRTASAATPAE
jgi:hypothetical protein